MVKNPPSNAGNVGSIHGQRTKILNAAKPMCSGAHIPLPEKPKHCNKEPSCHSKDPEQAS